MDRESHILRGMTESAVRAAYSQVRAQYGDAHIRGFAICSDENASTVFPKATLGVGAEFEFMPGEWEIWDGVECFDLSSGSP